MNKRLVELIDEYTKENVAIAFSGGVDSALLLNLACNSAKKNKTKVYAITANTKLHPIKDLEVSKKGAALSGAIHKIILIDELSEAGINDNPKDRCYRCKKAIFSKIIKYANENKVKIIMDGTNSDDLNQYRPGIKALSELGILSPFAELGITKREIREMAMELDLSVADRASSPCLATRLPYGDHIDYDILKKIDDGENFIRELGFYNVRLRIHGNIARIEVDDKDIKKLIDKSQKIIKYVKSLGFNYVTVDMEGFRSGSMDEI